MAGNFGIHGIDVWCKCLFVLVDEKSVRQKEREKSVGGGKEADDDDGGGRI